MNTLKVWFIYLCMGLITAGVSVSLYQQYAPLKVIDIHSPLKVKESVVKPGGEIIYIGDYCLYHQYPAMVYRTLVNNTSLPLPIVNTVGQLGCHTAEVQVPIPLGAEPGLYHLQGLVSYRVSPTRSIDVPFQTVDFTIK